MMCECCVFVSAVNSHACTDKSIGSSASVAGVAGTSHSFSSTGSDSDQSAVSKQSNLPAVDGAHLELQVCPTLMVQQEEYFDHCDPVNTPASTIQSATNSSSTGSHLDTRSLANSVATLADNSRPNAEESALRVGVFYGRNSRRPHVAKPLRYR